MRQVRQAGDRLLRKGGEPQACHSIAWQIADHRPQRMVEAEFGIAVRDEKQNGKMWDAPSFICPVDIFKYHDGGDRNMETTWK